MTALTKNFMCLINLNNYFFALYNISSKQNEKKPNFIQG
jgi:hypothetical protein